MTEAKISLRGDANGYWFLTVEAFGKEMTSNIGPGKAKTLINELNIPYVDPVHPLSDENRTPIDAQMRISQSSSLSWLLDIIVRNSAATSIIIDDRAGALLREMGIEEINAINWAK
jgi:hypothetical protein